MLSLYMHLLELTYFRLEKRKEMEWNDLFVTK